jgi:hypothetical protein
MPQREFSNLRFQQLLIVPKAKKVPLSGFNKWLPRFYFWLHKDSLILPP